MYDDDKLVIGQKQTGRLGPCGGGFEIEWWNQTVRQGTISMLRGGRGAREG